MVSVSNTEVKTILVSELLESGPAYQNSCIELRSGTRKGKVYIRDGIIVAAQAGQISGNGALLDLARWRTATISEFHDETEIQTNVFITSSDLKKISDQYANEDDLDQSYDDQELLAKALTLIHLFKYRDAFSLLTDIVRVNRFNYIAWVWLTRLLMKRESLQKAIGEALRWGGHDPIVQNEVEKLRQSLSYVEQSGVKRCLFCWMILRSDETDCRFCNASQLIKKNHNNQDVKIKEIFQAINLYTSSLNVEKTNTETAFTLALAYYNLGKYDKAQKYLEYISRLSPESVKYQDGMVTINSLVNSSSSRQTSDNNLPKATTQFTSFKSQPKFNGVTDEVASQGDNPVILVVEDSPTAQKVISMVLGREGFTIIGALSGKEALEKAEKYRPKLVLLDVMLPDTTGYDVLPKLRELEHLQDTPVIMLTGKKGALDRVKGLNAGSAEYLTKPFDPKKLTRLIKKYIQQ